MGKYSTSSSFSYAPYKLIIYGPEGIGKTLFASRFPDPVYLDTEGSTRHYDLKRIVQPNGESTPTSWQMVKEMAEAVRDGDIPCKTLVIDSLDWAEALCTAAVCAKQGMKGIEDFGYGKGYVYLEEEFGRFLNLLNEVYGKGINIVGTAHATMRRIELPEETGAFDHWELKLEKKTAALVKEWAQIILFANYETIVISGKNPMEKNKAAGGKRVMYSNHTPWFDAKNRFNLPEKMPLDFDAIKHLFLYEQPAESPQATVMAAPAPKPDTAGEQLSMNMPAREKPVQASPEEFEKESKEELPFKFGSEEYPGLPAKMADLARTAGMTLEDIKKTIGAGGWYLAGTPIEKIDPGFFDHLVAHWSDFVALWKKNK